MDETVALPSTPSRAAAGEAAGRLLAPERRALTLGLVLTVTMVGFEALAVATAMPIAREHLGALRLYGLVFTELHPHAGVDMPAPYTLTGLASSGPYTLTAYVHNEAPGVFTPTGLLVCGTLEGDDLAYARITGPSVGGTVELLAARVSDSPASPADASGSPIALYVVLAGSIAGGALALAAGGWYSRKRWLR